MSETSNIEWTDATWNPSTGCTKISPGCAHCYIETTPPFRMEGRKFVKGQIPLRLHRDRLDKPLHWRKPKRVFVNSLSDLFHEDVPDEFIDRVFAVMALCPQHTFQVLTKRAERMHQQVTRLSKSIKPLEAAAREMGHTFNFQGFSLLPWPIRNVWLGVSAERQQEADERIPWLLKTPAAVRFVSAEPLLGPIDFRKIAVPGTPPDAWLRPVHECREIDALEGMSFHPLGHGALGFNCPKLNWVIVGGESGHGARACDVRWVQGIVDQCKRTRVACFVKQLGARIVIEDASGDKSHPAYNSLGWRNDATRVAYHAGHLHTKDKKGGDPSEWPTDLRVRQWPQRTAT